MPWRGKIQLFVITELHPGAFINFIDCAGVNIIKVRIKKKAGSLHMIIYYLSNSASHKLAEQNYCHNYLFIQKKDSFGKSPSMVYFGTLNNTNNCFVLFYNINSEVEDEHTRSEVSDR